MIDSLGIITVQRCQNSAPAGFIVRVFGGSIAVNMIVLFAVSKRPHELRRNEAAERAGTASPTTSPRLAGQDDVRRFHAIGSEVQSNLIR